MKINSIELENIGKIIKEKIIIDQPLILFLGKIKQGKTTILNGIKYALGAVPPKDVLRHGIDKGHVLVTFDNSSIKRTFRRKNDGTIKSDKIQFILDGVLQDDPKKTIKQFLNPYLLDQNFFIDKSELEKNRYFVELFDVDVSGIDKDINKTDEAAKLMRATVAAYGEIDITPVEKPDIYALKKERTKILDVYNENKRKIDADNEDIEYEQTERKRCIESIAEKKLQLAKINLEINEVNKYLATLKERDILPPIPLPDTKKIDEDISDAKATNEKYKRYLENKERYDEKQSKNFKLAEIETQLRKLRANKVKKLADVSDKCGVPGLTFDANAIAKYKGSTLGMISGSEAIELSSALKSLYPEGFGIELIDGFESSGAIYGNEFGEPVQHYIEKARREKATILATVVGKKPAEVPEGVGVFIVKNGTLK